MPRQSSTTTGVVQAIARFLDADGKPDTDRANGLLPSELAPTPGHANARRVPFPRYGKAATLLVIVQIWFYDSHSSNEGSGRSGLGGEQDEIDLACGRRRERVAVRFGGLRAGQTRPTRRPVRPAGNDNANTMNKLEDFKSTGTMRTNPDGAAGRRKGRSDQEDLGRHQAAAGVQDQPLCPGARRAHDRGGTRRGSSPMSAPARPRSTR